MLFYLFTYTAVQHDFHIRLCSLRLTETGRVTYRITLGTLPDHPGSPPGFSWIRVAQSFVFCVVFCRSMSFCLFSFDQPWYCLSFFYLQLLITSDYLWLPLWYLLTMILSVLLLFTASDYLWLPLWYLLTMILSVLQNFWLLGAYLQAFLAIFPFCVILISVVGVQCSS
jgi:hypothetical protein